MSLKKKILIYRAIFSPAPAPGATSDNLHLWPSFLPTKMLQAERRSLNLRFAALFRRRRPIRSPAHFTNFKSPLPLPSFQSVFFSTMPPPLKGLTIRPDAFDRWKQTGNPLQLRRRVWCLKFTAQLSLSNLLCRRVLSLVSCWAMSWCICPLHLARFIIRMLSSHPASIFFPCA